MRIRPDAQRTLGADTTALGGGVAFFPAHQVGVSERRTQLPAVTVGSFAISRSTPAAATTSDFVRSDRRDGGDDWWCLG